MGEEAEDHNADVSDTLSEGEDKPGESGSSTDENGEDKPLDEAEQVSNVLAGDDGSQPDTKRPNRGFKRRIDKLNNRNEASKQEASQATERVEVLEQKNRLLELALAQKSEPAQVEAPDPSKFEDGVSDPRYIQANNDFLLSQVGETVKKHIPKQEPRAPQPNYDLRRRQERHLENADSLGVSDYEEVADAAHDILGPDVVNQLIVENDDSHLILYNLGKNPKRAKEIADLVRTNPIRAVMDLGALGEELGGKLQALRGKANLNQAPDPDTELSGAKPPAKGKRGPQGATYS